MQALKLGQHSILDHNEYDICLINLDLRYFLLRLCILWWKFGGVSAVDAPQLHREVHVLHLWKPTPRGLVLVQYVIES